MNLNWDSNNSPLIRNGSQIRELEDGIVTPQTNITSILTPTFPLIAMLCYLDFKIVGKCGR